MLYETIRVEYFTRAYSEFGYPRDRYNTHLAQQKSAEQFFAASEEMVQISAECIKDFHQ